MTRRSKVWLVAAVLFTVVNFAGGVLAAVQGEFLHASAHAGLLFLGVYYTRRIWRQGWSTIPDLSTELTDRLTHLEQSVGAVAIEVERIGEGQRFITRLFTGTANPRAPGESAGERIEIKSRDAPQGS
jgi:hypothetical protein